MKPGLRIPLVLAWTALGGAGLGASSACSSAAESQSATDAAVADGTGQDGDPAADTSEREASLPDSPQPPAECQAILDGAFVYFQADAATCPDGDTPIVI